MELHAFAEQVLFATNLEDKLQCPDVVTDEHPGPAVATPDAPGRPDHLHFKSQGAAKADFPGLHQLEATPERGRLLHFFANHELLATELMALVLLKFPDAPAAFRGGVLRTLKDEQEHTRLYLHRIRACGLEFGELPVSGYFWRCVAPMEHPIDYVAGLCLTFEQANLDFARHFARGFETVGDDLTAKLLERIYRDEIGHVAYGLKWFRRWKNPGESDWDAFCKTLKFPLSPQRAKGFTLNIEGRRAAGLDDQFIAQLNVYSQSKGRTPGVFVFNPFAEGRMAAGKGFNPTKYQAQLAHDLENLPQFLCRQDDIVLTSKRPSVEFLSQIKQAGFALPEFVEARPLGGSLTTRKLGSFRPWARSPDSLELFAPLFGNLTVPRQSPDQFFNPAIQQLYSKAWSAEFLRQFLRRKQADTTTSSDAQANPLPWEKIQSWLLTEDEIGVAVASLEPALAAIRAIRSRGHHAVVVKEAIGLAGSNALRLLEPELQLSQLRWLENLCHQKRDLVVEPWLERVQDFSVQLEMTTSGLKLCGYTGLIVDAKGQYCGNWAEPHHHTRIPAQVVRCFPDHPNISGLLLQLYAEIFGTLEAHLRSVGYLGPIGLDAFVYRDSAGTPRLKPVVEINPRYTMGRVLVELMHQTAQNSYAALHLVNTAQLRAEGFAEFSTYARSLEQHHPLQYDSPPGARLRQGALCLNDPQTARACLATFRVSRSLDQLPIKSTPVAPLPRA